MVASAQNVDGTGWRCHPPSIPHTPRDVPATFTRCDSVNARSGPRRGRILLIYMGENLERAKGFEPSTPTLARSCSTPELHPHPDRRLSWRTCFMAQSRRLGKGHSGVRAVRAAFFAENTACPREAHCGKPLLWLSQSPEKTWREARWRPRARPFSPGSRRWA
jgi:hypothetical protein